jgi:hypothetical protein
MSKITRQEIAVLLAEGESERAEFKRALPPENEIANTLAGFANSAGGVLLVGVGDDGRILGLTEEELEHTVDRIAKVASSLLPMPVNVAAIEVDGRSVVYASVERAPSHLLPVLTSSGQVFKRQGDWNLAVDFGTSGTCVAWRGEPHNSHLVVFVAMSFREEEDPSLVDYYRAMERAIAFTGLPVTLQRIDLVEGDYEISQEIMTQIDRADIVISDFTLNSPNVYFELGYARGRKKRVIQTARKGTVLEFDVRSWRTLMYRNATELEEKLVQEIRQAYAEIAPSDAPPLQPTHPSTLS